MKSEVGSRRTIRHPDRVANFDSGILPEPRILFGGCQSHVDPKTGLTLYGPYFPKGQSTPSLTSALVGIVGPPAMVANAEVWLTACRDVLTNNGAEPFLHPHFPGFRSDAGFHCELVYGDSMREPLRQDDITNALRESDDHARIKKVVDVYIQAIETLAGRDPKPQVIVCCIPQDIVDACTVGISRKGKKATRLNRFERQVLEDRGRGQLSLFDDMSPRLGIEDDVQGHQNLRRGLKAEAMEFGIPTQLVWPRSLETIDRPAVPGERRLQDVATRAWNFTTALYHKAGGTPWRLDETDRAVCYVGISFFREVLEANPRIRTSMAQAFTAAGDGYVLRGDSFEWDEKERGRSPHLDRKNAAALLREVLQLYKRQNRRSLPGRIVVHKSSRFEDEELAGFSEACKGVAQQDFVAFGHRGIQFYRTGMYPPLRGTYVKFSETDIVLYTDGYIPFLRTYPGARVPQPLEIVQHVGHSPWNTVLKEILALTKMNWNTADFACSVPITIAFSRKVGEILAELPEHLSPKQEYRFYM